MTTNAALRLEIREAVLSPGVGWRPFGWHVELSDVALMFGSPGPDGMPRQERHLDGSPCRCTQPGAMS